MKNLNIIKIVRVALVTLVMCLSFLGPSNLLAQTVPSAPEKKVTRIAPERLLVRPRSQNVAPKFFEDPKGWIQSQQRIFYGKMSKTLQTIRSTNSIKATWLLIAMSFVYGILHAAGPGHGKAVVSAWLLANEQQLKRGIIIAGMAAFVQAATAIVLVTGLLFVAQKAGSQARFFASSLETISFGLIAIAGLYLLWQTLRPKISIPTLASASHAHSHAHNGHSDHAHDNHQHDDECASQHSQLKCDCGHAHMPTPAQLTQDWSWPKAVSIAFAVGIRPCSGAILVLLLSSSIGLYWAGIASTFAMAIGTGITVSLVAVLTVTSKNLVVKLTQSNTALFEQVTFVIKLLAGIFIVLTGSFLFWASLPRALG